MTKITLETMVLIEGESLSLGRLFELCNKNDADCGLEPFFVGEVVTQIMEALATNGEWRFKDGASGEYVIKLAK